MSKWTKFQNKKPPVRTPVLIYKPSRENVLGWKIPGKQAIAYLTDITSIPIWWSVWDDEFLGYAEDIDFWRPQISPPEEEENVE